MIRKAVMHLPCLLACFLLLATSPAKAEVNDFMCGALQNAYGPFDYRTDKDKLGVVEAHHFTSEVATLVRAKSGYLGADLDYTLRAFPNHPRALMAMVQLGQREKVSRVASGQYSVECYLQRAIRFRNDDGMVKMIYANFLAKKGRSKEALMQLNDAADLGEGNASLDYNMALIYLDLKEYEKSLAYAHKAYLSGFPFPGLRERLKNAGKWRDPVAPLNATDVVDDPKVQPIQEKEGLEDGPTKN